MTATSSPPARRRSRRSRRVLHNSLIVIGTGAGAALLRPFMPDGLPATQDASILLGYASFALVMLTLTIGPRNLLLRRRNPVSTDLRRDLGIWGAVTAVAHVVFALQHHLDGRVAQYFFTSSQPSVAGLRRDAFGLGNHVGLAATLVIVLLVAISNDAALRKLGRRWKAWQRVNYGLAALVVVHTALFWRVLDRSAAIVVPAAAAAAAVLVVQLLGVRRYRRARLSRGRPRTS